jgi:hypothetical protein
MNTTTARDDEETLLQSSHREWIEDREREQQNKDKLFVERFLAGKLASEGSLSRERIGGTGLGKNLVSKSI